jgi:hypothetical protein
MDGSWVRQNYQAGEPFDWAYYLLAAHPSQVRGAVQRCVRRDLQRPRGFSASEDPRPAMQWISGRLPSMLAERNDTRVGSALGRQLSVREHLRTIRW